jgi:hypothetical protein
LTTTVTQPAPTPAKSLVSKLAEVMAAVERIPKRGRNDFHKYDYATEADIVAVVRQELAQRHIMLMPEILKETRTPVGDKGSVLTTLEMQMEFIDGESGETLLKRWLGCGTDKEDKGAYKAMTGGEKYFLLKTFLMPTGDDPEADDDKDRKPAGANGHSVQATRSAPPPPRETVNKATGEITDAGLLTVRDVATTDGATNGRKWTKFAIHFSDGSKATTLDRKLGEAAQKAKAAGATVRPLTKSGRFGTELEALDVVAALASAMLPATNGQSAPGLYEEPPGFMDVPDDDVQF